MFEHHGLSTILFCVYFVPSLATNDYQHCVLQSLATAGQPWVTGYILYDLILAHFNQFHPSDQSEIITTRCVIMGFINDQLLLYCAVIQGHQNLLVIKMDIVALKKRMNRYKRRPQTSWVSHWLTQH